MVEWRDVDGYESMYQVSNTGAVKSKERRVSGIIRGTHCIRTLRAQVIKESLNRGYSYVKLSKNNIAKSLKVHRLVAQAFVDNPEAKPHVNHINSIRDDNNASNLEWCTHTENIRHSFANGRQGSKPMLGKTTGTARAVKGINEDTEEEYEFPSAQSASLHFNKQRMAVNKAINGGWKCAGIKWEYKT